VLFAEAMKHSKRRRHKYINTFQLICQINKGANMSKSKTMQVRVTEKEFEIIVRESKKMKLDTVSAFVRYKLGLSIIIPAKLK
jgi:hypothetical protein